MVYPVPFSVGCQDSKPRFTGALSERAPACALAVRRGGGGPSPEGSAQAHAQTAAGRLRGASMPWNLGCLPAAQQE